MLSTLQVHESLRALVPYPYDTLFNIHDYNNNNAYANFPIPPGVLKSNHEKPKNDDTHHHHHPKQHQQQKQKQQLPFDIKHILLTHLLSSHSPRDLLALALTCTEWAETIIPEYLYRQLDVRLTPTPGEIWKALASRPYLATGTRAIRLHEPTPTVTTTTTMNKNNAAVAGTGTWTPSTTIATSTITMISLALPNCSSVRQFCWTGSRTPLEVTWSFVRALALCPVLEELDLGPVVLSPGKDDKEEEEGGRVTVGSKEASRDWKFKFKLERLTKLSLRGDWDRSRPDVLYLSLIQSSPNLEELSLLYNPASIHFTSCALTKLRKLHLWHDASYYFQFGPESEMEYPYDAEDDSDRIVGFLMEHPGIEDLRWFAPGTSTTWSSASGLNGTLSSPSLDTSRASVPQHKRKLLPNLKRLHAHEELTRVLLLQDSHDDDDDNSNSNSNSQHKPKPKPKPKWESISLGSSAASLHTDLSILENSKLDLSNLREVRLASFEGNFDSLVRLARLAAGSNSIEMLGIQGFGPSLPAQQRHGTTTQAPMMMAMTIEARESLSVDLDKYFTALSHFPHLETVLDTRLWASILRLSDSESPSIDRRRDKTHDQSERSKAIASLTSKCPALRRMSHWDASRRVWVDIFFEREWSCHGVDSDATMGTTRWYEMPSLEEKEDWERFGGV